jgi:selenobiotic family peptide radical SAM maturase
MNKSVKNFDEVFPVCLSLAGIKTWYPVIDGYAAVDPEELPDILSKTGDKGLPQFLPDLARLEWTVHKVLNGGIKIAREVKQICVNPTVHLLPLSWKNLPSLIQGDKSKPSVSPEPGEEMVVVWRDPKTGGRRLRPATGEDLLVLKIIAEGIRLEVVAEEGGLSVGTVDAAIERAILNGLLLSPKSRILRDPVVFGIGETVDEQFLSSFGFTLQWHITQACDLHCRHCYDRSERSPMRFDQAIRILDDLHAFCKNKRVMGAVSFTGGNPLLYPHFIELYRAASERGFALSILGNPTSEKKLEEILAVRKPTHFQVSLEGLPEHNDFIRGEGHFARITRFLELLRKYRIFSMVMLTLTRDNMDQVLPLAERLCGFADRFHFNRLSMVGEGANLKLPEKTEYRKFLEQYLEEAERNPILGLKDNLINILRYEKGLDLFGGCSGYGCGAAFNFLAVLPDGEVHACRKFPSPIGNIFSRSIEEIYDSEKAVRYRSGSSSCISCAIRPVCGGCFASAYSHNLNIFEEKDPFCFL